MATDELPATEQVRCPLTDAERVARIRAWLRDLEWRDTSAAPPEAILGDLDRVLDGDRPLLPAMLAWRRPARMERADGGN